MLDKSFPSIQGKIVKRQLSSETKGKGFSNKKKIIVNNVKTEYVTKNSSVFLNNTKKILTKGDLEVDGKNSHYIGRHIIRNGDRPQRISRTYQPMSEFYNLNKNLFDKNEVFVDSNITMSGCFKSNKETLQRTMIPEIECLVSARPSMETIKIFEPAIKNAIRKLKIKELSNCNVEDLSLTSFNKNTYPGFHLKEYCGYEDKNSAAADAFKIATKRWKNIEEASKSKIKLKRNKIFPNTFVVGARNKREYFYEDGEILTSRAVHMPEFASEINSTIWIEQITNHLKEKQHGPLYIGNSIVKYERLLKDLGDSKFCIEGDWKRFDSRLYITNIIIGIAILRLYFPLNDKTIDFHFLAMFDTIGIKDYYTPGGYLYRIIHGLPSGVCSTSLLGSIINLVNLLYCTKDIPSKRMKFIVGGDDFLISLSNEIKQVDESTLDKINKNAEEIGQVFKILKLKRVDSENVNERPCFFKYTIDRNEAIVYPISLLERTFLPWNKVYNSNYKIFNFLHDLIPSLGAPRSCHLPFYYFYRSIYNKVSSNKISVSEVLSLHQSIYYKVTCGERFYKKEQIIYYKNFSFVTEAQLSSRISYFPIFLDKGNKRRRFKIKF